MPGDTLPGWTIGYDPPPVALDEADAIVEMWQAMGQSDTGEGGDPVVGSVAWTDDGVHPNELGAQTFTYTTLAAIDALNGNWGKK